MKKDFIVNCHVNVRFVEESQEWGRHSSGNCCNCHHSTIFTTLCSTILIMKLISFFGCSSYPFINVAAALSLHNNCIATAVGCEECCRKGRSGACGSFEETECSTMNWHGSEHLPNCCVLLRWNGYESSIRPQRESNSKRDRSNEAVSTILNALLSPHLRN